MLVYHGSYIEIQKPNLTFGRYNLDFGKGFYTTTLKEQAEKWAFRRVATEKLMNTTSSVVPIVNIYDFNSKDENLNILSFDGYSEEWLDFVIHNRSTKFVTTNNDYDAVYGNVADDDVARAVNDYMELLNKGRVNEDVKKALLYQLKFSKPNNQYCFISDKALEQLKFINSYIVEDNNNGK